MTMPRLLALCAILFLPCTPIRAQTLLSRLKWLRTQEIAERHFEQRGMRLVPRPTDPLGVKSDSIRKAVLLVLDPPDTTVALRVPVYEITSVRSIAPAEVEQYRERFTATEWAFLGSTRYSDVDTMMTRDIRARMEHLYGPPTRTILETGIPMTDGLPGAESDDAIEFEYWFVLNDSLQAFVLDVNGPWDRGVVLSVPSAYRDILIDVKSAFLGRIVDSPSRAPFADYYYNEEQGYWYITGYDGASFFDVRTDRPNPEAVRPRIRDLIERGRLPRQGPPDG